MNGAEPALELLPDFISNRAAVLLSNLARGLDSALSILIYDSSKLHFFFQLTALLLRAVEGPDIK